MKTPRPPLPGASRFRIPALLTASALVAVLLLAGSGSSGSDHATGSRVTQCRLVKDPSGQQWAELTCLRPINTAGSFDPIESSTDLHTWSLVPLEDVELIATSGDTATQTQALTLRVRLPDDTASARFFRVRTDGAGSETAGTPPNTPADNGTNPPGNGTTPSTGAPAGSGTPDPGTGPPAGSGGAQPQPKADPPLAEPGPIFVGTCPPVPGYPPDEKSWAILELDKDFANQHVIRWRSADSVIFEVEDTGFVSASRWILSGANPQRLIFTARAVSKTEPTMWWDFYGDVLLEPYNRAVVDVVAHPWVPAKRIRYLLTAPIDLDVDSDNTNGTGEPDQNLAEEGIENRSDLPGKIVRVNTGDINLNFSEPSGAVPNWADGIDKEHPANAGLDAVNNNNANASPRFVPLILKLAPGVDPAKAKFRFTYPASDPDALVRVVNARSAAAFRYPFLVSYQLPAGGALRLWREDGPMVRRAKKITDTPAGDFIPAATPIDATKLGFSPTVRTNKLYVEAVAVSAALGDLPIKVELDPTGGGTYTASDQVRLTSIQVRFEEHPSGNTYGFDPTDEGIVDLQQVVEKSDQNLDLDQDGDPDHLRDQFPQPPIPNNPTVRARQLSVAWETGAAAAAHGTTTKVKVTVLPAAISPSLLQFRSEQPTLVVVPAQATDAGGGLWELQIEGRGRYEDLDNQVVIANLQTDATSPEVNMYVFQRLTVYSFTEAKLKYDYYRVEDMRPLFADGVTPRNTSVSHKADTTLAADADGTKTVHVRSTAGYQAGDAMLLDNRTLGVIRAIDGAANRITLDQDVPAPPAGPASGASVYSISLGPAEFTEANRTADQVLRRGVVSFRLGITNAEAVNSPYDFDPADSQLTYPNDTPGSDAEETQILTTLGKPGTDHIIVRVRSITDDKTGYTVGRGAIFISDTANDYTIPHEALHGVTLRHDRDDADNVMWYRNRAVKPGLDNTPSRVSGNNNICESERVGGNQRIQRQWSEISPR